MDLTQLGTIIARVTAPLGGGNKDPEVIRDGDKPAAGSDASASRQYDTWDGDNAATEDWIGYEYASDYSFVRAELVEGKHYIDGGWFETLGVQVRQSSVWVDVSNLVITPTYPGADDGVEFNSYTLEFDTILGDGIRIFGTPGGTAAFISVAELEVFGIDATCGDGVVDAGEDCDDGNAVDGDGCDSNCTVTACGNGIVTAGEACDDGNAIDGDGCDSNCTVTACGNGIITGTEECDDGNLVAGDGCGPTCLTEFCGDGITNNGEACDDAGESSTCDADCTPVACGDGTANTTAGEGCDDGNAVDGDGCDSNCTVTACGNGIVTAGEGCDDGNAVDGDGCDSNCTVTACGNGVVTAGEVCDDGNAVDGDGCDSNCTVTACGNGVVTAGEGCDDGNAVDGDGCDSNCTVTACGNGIVTAGEVCDDGNLIDGDGCDANCQPSGCGNGVVSGGEICDDGNLVDGDGCDSNCTPTGCGNSITTAGEECDDGNTAGGDGCGPTCLTEFCGDGIVNNGEPCDDGGESASCDADCSPVACGDGTINETAGEICDDGNTVNGDGCEDDCTFSNCGDGFAQYPEECDDGNGSNGDGCTVNCKLEDVSGICSGVPSVGGTGITSVLFANGLDRPVDIQAPPLDPHRLFVVEQEGRIRLIKNGVLQPGAFLDISALTSCCGEQGLLGMAFHPDYANNRRFFVNLTDNNGDTVIARYEAMPGNPDSADPASATILLTIPQPDTNHNGGQLAFGPDGYLYTGLGDGGTSFKFNSQDPATLLGKMLRIDVDVETLPFYAIPPTNPNAGAGDPLGLIWANGLRNPWRFSFDRSAGDLYIADVGEGSREEIDYEPMSTPGGLNYGWKVFEGTECFDPSPAPDCPSPPTGFTMPVHEYAHTEGCSITGGYVYRGCMLPALAGTYFYADYCSAFIKTLKVVGGAAQDFNDRTGDLDPGPGLGISLISTFGQDARGEMYIADIGGEIFKIVPNGEACGDGIVTAGEDCDDAGESALCDADCTFAACGDGTLNLTAGETCDDGNAVNGDGCDANCTTSGCGNGIVTPPEQCDDGNASNSDDCLNNCTAASCGDGFLQVGTEQCDDGNLVDGDGCSSSCESELLCGDANDNGEITASDALIVLKNGVGVPIPCPDWLCDYNGDGSITSSDALDVLERSVGLLVPPSCPAAAGLLLRLTSTETLGALQLDIDYSGAAGDFVGAGGAVACNVLTASTTDAYNNDTVGESLAVSLISVQGFTGPTNLVHCEFNPTGLVAPPDFGIAIIDAVDPDGISASPTVEIILF